MDEALISDVMFRTMAFPLITYVLLQVAAIMMTKHWGWRIAAALPLIPFSGGLSFAATKTPVRCQS